ncbi:MAG TPA: hypothetical protein VM759_12560 [Longimicrobium sp.]|nr:hypothetical protein [Longimicrobium sp.]
MHGAQREVLVLRQADEQRAQQRTASSAARASAGTSERSTKGRGTGIAGRTTCTGSPSMDAKVVRRISCRRTIPASASASASEFSRPRSRTATGMLYAALVPTSCAMNHMRAWADEVGRTNTSSSAAGAGWMAASSCIFGRISISSTTLLRPLRMG